MATDVRTDHLRLPAGRPALHATAPAGWLNDPHGLIRHADRYHLFHQAVPDSLEWRSWCSWGHLSSPDLITWTAHPTALAPDDGDHGCWSGDVHLVDGSAVLFYTSVNPPELGIGTVRTARPLDEAWTAWRKGPAAVSAPAGERLHTFRDPTVFRDGDVWRMLVGAGFEDGRAAALGFSSTDLITWTYDGPLVARSSQLTEPLWTGTAWECPHLVPVGDRHVLIVSVWDGSGRYVAAATGNYAAGRMTVDHWTRLTHGPSHYAPTTFVDADGRPGVMFWLRDAARPGDGWAGALSIPYRLDLVGDRPQLEPHPQVRASAPPGPARVLGLDWGIPGRAPSGRLTLRTTGGAALVTLTAVDGQLHARAGDLEVTAPLGRQPVRVLLDASILEICTGGALLGMALPAGPDEAIVGPDAPEVAYWWPSGAVSRAARTA